MAFPTTISGLQSTGSNQNMYGGPFISSGGDVYVVGITSGDNSAIEVSKASDPTSSFTAQDTSNNPDPNTSIVTRHLSACAYNNKLYVVFMQSSYGTYFCRFNMGTDSWETVTGGNKYSTIQTYVESTPATPRDQSICGVAVRSSGDVYVHFLADAEMSMGSLWGRCHWTKSTDDGATWATSAATWYTSSPADEHYMPGTITPDSTGRLHIPHVNNDADGYWLYPNVIKTNDTVNAGGSGAASGITTSGKIMPGVYYDDGGTERVRFPLIDGVLTSENAMSVKFDAVDNPTYTTDTVDSDAKEFGVAMVLSGTKELMILFQDESDYDVYSSTNDDDGGWTARNSEEALGATDKPFLFGNKINRSGQDRFAYVRGDTAGLLYNEVDLGGGTPDTGYKRLLLLGVG